MGQKTSPILLRLGINTTWSSHWDNQFKIASTNHYSHALHNDLLTREYLNVIYKKFCIRPSTLNMYLNDKKGTITKGFSVKDLNLSYNTFKKWYIQENLPNTLWAKKVDKIPNDSGRINTKTKTLQDSLFFSPPLLYQDKKKGVQKGSINARVSLLSYKNTLSFYNYLNYIYQLHKNKYDSKLILYNIRKLYEIKKRLYFLNTQLNFFTKGYIENYNNQSHDKLNQSKYFLTKNIESLGNTHKTKRKENITKLYPTLNTIKKQDKKTLSNVKSASYQKISNRNNKLYRNYYFRFLLPSLLVSFATKNNHNKKGLSNRLEKRMLVNVGGFALHKKKSSFKIIKKSLKKTFWIKRNFNLNYFLVEKNNLYIKTKLSRVLEPYKSNQDNNQLKQKASLNSFNLFLHKTLASYKSKEKRLESASSYYISSLYIKLITLYLWRFFLASSLFNHRKFFVYKTFVYNSIIKTLANPLLLKFNQFKLLKAFLFKSVLFGPTNLFHNNFRNSYKTEFSRSFKKRNKKQREITGKIKLFSEKYSVKMLQESLQQEKLVGNFCNINVLTDNILSLKKSRDGNSKLSQRKNYIKVILYKSLLKDFKVYNYIFSHFFKNSKNSFFFYQTEHVASAHSFDKNVHKHTLESYYTEKHSIHPSFNDFLLSCQEYYFSSRQQNTATHHILNISDVWASKDKGNSLEKNPKTITNIQKLQTNFVQNLPTKARLGNVLLRKQNNQAIVQLNLQTAPWSHDAVFHQNYNPFLSKRFKLPFHVKKNKAATKKSKKKILLRNVLRQNIVKYKKFSRVNKNKTFKYFPQSLLSKSRLQYPANLFFLQKPFGNCTQASRVFFKKKNILSMCTNHFLFFSKKAFSKKTASMKFLEKQLQGNLSPSNSKTTRHSKAVSGKNTSCPLALLPEKNYKVLKTASLLGSLLQSAQWSFLKPSAISSKTTIKNPFRHSDFHNFIFFKFSSKKRRSNFSKKKFYDKPSHFASPLLTFLGQLNRQNHIFASEFSGPRNTSINGLVENISASNKHILEHSFNNPFFERNPTGKTSLQQKWNPSSSWKSKIFFNTLKDLWRINHFDIIIKRHHSKVFDSKILVENLSKFAIAFIKKNKGGKNKSQKLKNITAKIMTTILYNKHKKPNPHYLGGAFGFSGRVYGGKKAASFKLIYGNLPFNTLKARIDYANVVQNTKNGTWNFETWLNMKKRVSNNVFFDLPRLPLPQKMPKKREKDTSSKKQDVPDARGKQKISADGFWKRIKVEE